ncbi:GNAT family N-acetyltransferase [Nocardioides nitrophenolicus]|uniref:GNAT family N-acetyltransferase n=1 Tax=Nocardioides nitrophenolicus TaxID=60489 RepID=UPI001959CFAE|nr:GNAT family N-acetyltransferase [Nocardioides nitrophenolicus]MBM7515310.1 GNAT superfamily N-acetyltransferase [Nocardioides nitrophenolicus]
MTPTELLLRPATPADVPGIAAVQVAARASAAMPPGIHGPEEIRTYLAARFGAAENWVAEAGGRVVGYARFTREWLNDLYVDPAHQGAGVGGALLDLVKARHPEGFSLWVFEQNAPARAFYAARGLVEREHTDGSENEERAPDLRMEWAPGSVGGSS